MFETFLEQIKILGTVGITWKVIEPARVDQSVCEYHLKFNI